MSFAFAAAAGLLAAALVWVVQKLAGGRRRSGRMAFRKRDTLLSPEERRLLAGLREALGDEFDIFARVRAMDLVSPHGGDQHPGDLPDIGPLLNFVLCRRGDGIIACAIRLRKPPAGSAADTLRGFCQAAGLPLIDIIPAPAYDGSELKAAVTAALRPEPIYATEPGGRKEPGFSGIEDLEL